MLTVHIKKELATLRVYEGENSSYESRKGRIFSCNLHYISDHEIYICNAVGELTREILKEILKEFRKDDKVTTLRIERRGDIKEYQIK